VSLVQLDVTDGDATANLKRAESLIGQHPGADIYLLPELWTTGYRSECWPGSADHDTPGTLNRLAGLSRSTGAWIGGSVVTRLESGRLANRFWLHGPDGAVAAYDKAHLFEPMGEPDHLAAGGKRVRVRIAGWDAALSICYDLRFPEMYRRDALDGAALFLVVSAWPLERQEHMLLLARARAVENQAYMALCNRTGTAEDGVVFGGESTVVAPDGTIVASAGRTEAVATAELSGRLVDAVRERLRVLAQRREHVDW
jgi:predicted amidohydrolase